ncbi:aminotransferase class IV [Metallumcola ferriviriculae]|uniref:Aminotransferase class IV n=1 Tax=Metallumcola ferriviriculae TaxID=3039180 RepID=A0AAU0USW8_9FIRM|nr:aminotransferase class IV [Desulfitibacteraceae bacterium MK1]
MDYGYHNGNILPREELIIDVADLGFQYGLGLFETVKINHGKPIWLEEHISRLQAGLEVLHISPAGLDGELSSAVPEVIRATRLEMGSVKIMTSGYGPGRPDNVFVTVKKGIPYSHEQRRKGFSVAIVSLLRRNPLSPFVGLKSLNFGENILARSEVAAKGADEGLLLNTDGFTAEGTVSNIFWYDGKVLKTPSISAGILPGIARAKIMETAAKLTIPVQQVLAEPGELSSAQEIFLTNSLMGIMPVTVFEGKPLAREKNRIIDVLNGELDHIW